ncbi:MAG TPA: type VII secretion target [Mycobacteriales bacterium]|jgi:Protein of unknown function (DUF2580).
MPEDLHVDPNKLRACAERTDDFATRAAKIRSAAHDADVNPLLWGQLGMMLGLPIMYESLSGQIYQHLDLMKAFLAGATTGLRTSADNYAAAEESIHERLRTIDGSLDTGTVTSV